jgi:hypothetical protein
MVGVDITFIIGVRTIGYITSIVHQAINHLSVSPIEFLGFFFSMLVILHSIVHSVGAICQNPLVKYLNPTQETEILDKYNSTRWFNNDSITCAKCGDRGNGDSGEHSNGIHNTCRLTSVENKLVG